MEQITIVTRAGEALGSDGALYAWLTARGRDGWRPLDLLATAEGRAILAERVGRLRDGARA